jgi:hypothetical protein
MRRHRTDQLLDNGLLVMHDKGIAGSDHRPAAREQPGVAATVTRAQGNVVEGGSVRLDHDAVLDDEVHSADPRYSDLRAHAEPEFDGDHPSDRLEPRLRTPIEQIEPGSAVTGKSFAEVRELPGMQLPEVERAVDTGHPFSTTETARGIHEGVDQLGAGWITGGSLRPAPVHMDTAVETETRRMNRHLHVHGTVIQHPDATPPQFGHAGQATAGTDRAKGRVVNIGGAEVAAPSPDQRAAIERSADLAIGRPLCDQLSAGDVFHIGRIAGRRLRGRG